MGWFRSEEMAYVTILMNKDAAHQCVDKLGKLEDGKGAIQFIDLNTELTTFQRRYVPQIKRCDEMERQLRYFRDELKKHNVAAADAGSGGIVDHFKQNMLQLNAGDSADTTLQAMEGFVAGKYNELMSINEQLMKLTRTHNEHVELKEVLQACLKLEMDSGPVNAGQALGSDVSIQSSQSTNARPLLAGGPVEDFGFQYLCGVVPATEKLRFDRMIFRATRGNVMTNFFEIATPIVDPESGEQVTKLVFILVFKSEAIERKLRKLCDAHSAKQYGCNPRNTQELETRLRDMDEEIADTTRALGLLHRAQIDQLQRIGQSVEIWQFSARQEKAIYHTLNFFKDDIGGMLKAEGWVIKSSVSEVDSCIQRAHNEIGGGGDSDSMPCSVHEQDHFPSEPPTHYKLDKFSAVFQELVNTYGTPRYREINPAVFTAITFPFLFGVMYGDVGHGTCLLLGGLYLVMTESSREGKKLGELMSGLHLGRYLILMMGIFAVYCGFVYNDFFALSLNIMPGGAQWEFTCPCQPPTGTDNATILPWTAELCEAPSATTVIPTDGHCMDDLPRAGSNWVCDPTCCCGGGGDLPTQNGKMTKGSVARSKHTANGGHAMAGFHEGYVYPFGLDPLWKGTSNELAMFNSFKMKVSVILGILQMCFGICLKGANAILARDGKNNDSMLDFWYEFLPQMGFASGLFLYMIFMIFLKWSINWEDRMMQAHENNGVCPDSIGELMCQPPSLINTLINIALAIGTVDERLYASQPLVQTILLLVAVGCVPVMLLVKPYALKARYGKKAAHPELMEDDEDRPVNAGGGGHGHDGEFNFAEVFIHQCIETIEFVLGMVSNTASYLRLWALSLAHSELALVFWEQLMVKLLGMGPVGAFLGFGGWAAVTTAVLLMMDVLECFLHALRLHWVEFQNKFYKADGFGFEPLGFSSVFKSMQN